MKTKKTAGNMIFSTIIVMVGLLFTKGSGFLRDILVGIKFDQNLYRDAFTLAFTIPDLFYNLLVGGAIFSTVAPYMSGAISVGEEKRGIKTVSIFVSVISVVMATACAIGTIFSKPIYSLYALRTAGDNGIDEQTLNLAANASKLLFPQIFFIMLAALCIGIMNSYKRFTATSFGPTIYNICVLLSLVFFAGSSPEKLYMTTGGILVSAIIYFLFQYFMGFDKLRQFKFNFRPNDREFRKLFWRALPILFSSSIVQVNVVILNYFAGKFDSGSIYGFRNASTIWQIPYGIFTVAISTVMTPELAGLYESKKYKEASSLLSRSLKTSMYIMIPASLFIWLESLDVVKAIYQWTSSYTNTNAETASVFLKGFVTAIITASVIHIINHAFYAIGKTRVPFWSSFVGMIMNPLFCWTFIRLGMGPLSLSAAYSLTNFLQMVFLIVIYCRNKELAPTKMISMLIKSVACAVVAFVIVFMLDILLPAQGGKIVQLSIIACKGAACLIVYFGMGLALKMDEAMFWINKLSSKFKRRAQKKAEEIE